MTIDDEIRRIRQHHHQVLDRGRLTDEYIARALVALEVCADTLQTLDSVLPISFGLGLPYDQSEAKARIRDTLALAEKLLRGKQ